MNTFFPVIIRYRNLTKFIVFNWIHFNILPILLYQQCMWR